MRIKPRKKGDPLLGGYTQQELKRASQWSEPNGLPAAVMRLHGHEIRYEPAMPDMATIACEDTDETDECEHNCSSLILVHEDIIGESVCRVLDRPVQTFSDCAFLKHGRPFATEEVYIFFGRIEDVRDNQDLLRGVQAAYLAEGVLCIVGYFPRGTAGVDLWSPIDLGDIYKKLSGLRAEDCDDADDVEGGTDGSDDSDDSDDSDGHDDFDEVDEGTEDCEYDEEEEAGGDSDGSDGSDDFDDSDDSDDSHYPEPIRIEHAHGPCYARIEHLPRVLRDMLIATADSVQVAVESALVLAIGLLATVLQGRLVVQPKSDPEYVEQLCFFGILIFPTSVRKSELLKRLIKAVKEVQEARMRKAAAQRASAERELLEIESELAELANSEDPDLEALLARKEELQKLARFTGQMLVQDVTQEALAALLHTEGTLAYCVDEIHLPTLMGTRWNSAPDLTLLLQAFSGADYVVNRKSSPPMYIEKPHLSIVAGTQPCVIEELFSNPIVVQRGLAGRLCVVAPPLPFGKRVYHSESVPEAIAQGYADMVHKLAALPENRLDPPRLFLSSDAYDLVAAFFEETDKALAASVHDPARSGLLGKLPGIANRLAGILHAVRYADRNAGIGLDISGKTMRNAIELARFFLAHASVVTKAAQSGVAVQEIVWKKIRDAELTRFRASELWQMMKGSRHIKTMDDLKKALDGLSERHYILPSPLASNNKPGRKPSPEYDVNPRALKLDDAI